MAQPLRDLSLSTSLPTPVRLAGRTSRRLVEFVVDELTLDPTTLSLAAARADVVRLRFSSALPSHAAVRALVGMLDDELAALGRARTDVRVLLEVETVVAEDEADAVRRRANLAYTAAFSHGTWSPASTWVVAPVSAVAGAARALADRTGVDEVELVLVGRSGHRADELAAALTGALNDAPAGALAVAGPRTR